MGKAVCRCINMKGDGYEFQASKAVQGGNMLAYFDLMLSNVVQEKSQVACACPFRQGDLSLERDVVTPLL